MKKIIISMLACCICASGVIAQEQSAAPAQSSSSGSYHKMYLGGRYQFTTTNLDLKSHENGDITTDFVLGHGWGGVMGWNLGRNAALQFEIMYNSLAQEYKHQDKTQRINLSYLNVPLLFMLNTDASKAVNLNICAGPQLGINTGADIETTSGGSGTDTVHAVLAVKTGDIGFAYGAGIDFLLGPTLRLSVGYRGVQGLVDISDESQNLTTDEFYILDRSHVTTHSGYIGLSFVF